MNIDREQMRREYYGLEGEQEAFDFEDTADMGERVELITDSLGCVGVQACPLAETDSCTEDIHHTFHPKNIYRTKTEKTFRNLPQNKVVMCRHLHNIIHQTALPPEKPDHETMVRIINGKV